MCSRACGALPPPASPSTSAAPPAEENKTRTSARARGIAIWKEAQAGQAAESIRLPLSPPVAHLRPEPLPEHLHLPHRPLRRAHGPVALLLRVALLRAPARRLLLRRLQPRLELLLAEAGGLLEGGEVRGEAGLLRRQDCGGRVGRGVSDGARSAVWVVSLSCRAFHVVAGGAELDFPGGEGGLGARDAALEVAARRCGGERCTFAFRTSGSDCEP